EQWADHAAHCLESFFTYSSLHLDEHRCTAPFSATLLSFHRLLITRERLERWARALRTRSSVLRSSSPRISRTAARLTLSRELASTLKPKIHSAFVDFS